MKEKRLPKCLRKYIRKEKARIRREVFGAKEQEKLIQELYKNIRTKNPACNAPPARNAASTGVGVAMRAGKDQTCK